jgi:NADPH:quinone reductase-like Zn-dependent oxidoreductase
VYERYGSPEVIQLREVPKPVPKDDEVLIRIRATSVTIGDYRARSLDLPPGFGLLGRLMFGFVRPRHRILGYELAGGIEAVGKDVKTWKAGDAVFGATGFTFGAYAEYRCLKATAALAAKPDNLSFEEATALPFGGETALYFLDKAGLKRGESILVNGASGCVGTAMVQIARHRGAEVTGVTSTGNVELVRSLGAGRVIDYTKTDFSGEGTTYDVIADCVGNAKFARSAPLLRDGGRLVEVVAGFSETLMNAVRRPKRGIQVIGGGFKETADHMRTLADLARDGHFRPYIDRTYPFEQIVEAHRYVDTGRKRGSVVVTVGA